MPRKGENIHLRKDGRWEARITIEESRGISKKKSLYGKTYREVKEKLRNAKEYSETITDFPNSQTKTTAEVVEEWFQVNSIRQKRSTQLKYRIIADRHILPAFGDMQIQQLNEKIINQFLSEKLKHGGINRQNLSASYVTTMGIVLNSIISYAVSMDYRNPLKSKITKPYEEKKDIVIMDKTSQLLLEQALLRQITPVSVGIMLALHAGLRIGEICALKWEEIELEKGIIHIRHTVIRIQNNDKLCPAKTKLIVDRPKTKTSYRDIPINTKLLDYLKKAKKLLRFEYVASGKETFLSPRTFEYRFHVILQKCGIQDINAHALRHTFATRCVEMGVDVKTLSEILGHANVGITLNTYVHSSFDLKRSQIEKLTLLQ